jgi:hypothetical protein
MTTILISDKKSSRLFRFDANGDDVHVHAPVQAGAGAYPADMIQNDADTQIILVSTRARRSAQPVNIRSMRALPRIALSHKPRSTTLGPKGTLAAIAGADQVRLTLIDAIKRTVVRSFGSGDAGARRDFGGNTACGHPAWTPQGGILLLDRINREIQLFNPAQTGDIPLDVLKVPTSAHHITRFVEPNGAVRLFAYCEGNPAERLAPTIVEFVTTDDTITEVARQVLPASNDDNYGGHHLTVDALFGCLYAGTANGHLHIYALDGLTHLTRVKTGQGCGHVTLCDELAVVTNHTDTYMSVFNRGTGTPYKSGKIEVSDVLANNEKTQGHTAVWDEEHQRLYTTAAGSGRFLVIDPFKRKVMVSIAIDGAVLIQGASVSSHSCA